MTRRNISEIELQIMAAVVECSHQDFLPPALQKIERAYAAQRLAVLKEQFKTF